MTELEGSVPESRTEPQTRTVEDVLRLAIGTDTARLIAHDPVARIGEDPEGVHQARVATRRLRSHLQTFAPVIREEPVARLGKRLRWIGRALGVVRDLDVLSERFARSVTSFDPMTREDGMVLLGLMDAERERAATRLGGVLSSDRYRELVSSMAVFVVDPPLRGAAARPALAFLRQAIQARYDALDEAIASLSRSPSDVRLHQVRIVAKPARYAAELGGSLLGDPCSRLAKRLADLCDELGLLNDGARANEWLDHAGADPIRALAVARLRAVEIDRMGEARAEWGRQWERVRAAAEEMGFRHAPLAR